MEKPVAECRTLHRKGRKSRKYVQGPSNLGTLDRSLAEEQAAHRETCISLDAAIARLEQIEHANTELNAVVQPLNQCVSDLTAELKQKQKDLQLLSTQSAEAGGRASTKLSDMLARLRAQEHKIQQQQSAAARELAAAHELAACELAAARNLAARELTAYKQQAVEQLSQVQLAHGAMLTKLQLEQVTQAANACIASLQQQLQDKDASLTAAEACKQEALNDLAAQQCAMKAATSQVAILQGQLANAQDSLAQLQNQHQAAHDEIASQKAASVAAKAHISDLELRLECITNSQVETEGRYKMLSADLAAHVAAAGTAESRTRSLQVQLQDSSSRCAELQAAVQIAQDGLAQHASAAAAAANTIQELDRLRQDALAKLQQMQVAKNASICQHLKATDAAAKAHRDKCALKDAEIRAYRWKLAQSEAGIKGLQHQALQLHQQLAAAADGATQVKVQLQTAVLGRTAAITAVEEAESVIQLVKQQLHAAQCKLSDAEDQLFGWACAAAATATTATDVTSRSADPADGALGSTSQTLHTVDCSTNSRRGIHLHNLCKPLKPLNKVFKRLGALCSGGLRSTCNSTSSTVGEMHQEPVLNSFLGSQPHTSTAPPPRMPLHGIADLVAHRISLTARECKYAAAEAAAAAAVAGSKSGISDSTAVAAVRRLSRWGSAAAGAGDAGPRPSCTSDTAVCFIDSTRSSTEPQSSNAGDSVADLAAESLATCDDQDHTEVDEDVVTVTMLQQNFDSKTGGGPALAATMMHVGSVVSM